MLKFLISLFKSKSDLSEISMNDPLTTDAIGESFAFFRWIISKYPILSCDRWSRYFNDCALDVWRSGSR